MVRESYIREKVEDEYENKKYFLKHQKNNEI